MDVEVPDRAHLPSGVARDDLPYCNRQLRSGNQRVLPLRHRRRPRMIREAGDHRAIALDRHDPLHDTDGRAARLQRAALLDVELEVAVVGAFRPDGRLDPIRLTADPPDGLRARHSVPRCCQIGWRVVARGDAAAREAAAEGDAFFGRPDGDLERMPRRVPRATQRLDHAQRRERAEVAVEVAARRHRIDVRAEDDGRRRRVAPGAAREDVARRIDPRLELRGAHEVDRVLAAGDVGVRVRDPTDAARERAAWGTAEDAQRLDSRAECARVDGDGGMTSG